MSSNTKLICFLICAAISYSCEIPKDSRDSWEHAYQNGLEVGIVENPPFVTIHEDSVAGTELEMIRDFAMKEGLQLKLVSGSETALVEKLHQAELQLLIGGFDKKTLWEEKAGLSIPYDQDDHVILIPKGENKLLYRLESFIKSR